MSPALDVRLKSQPHQYRNVLASYPQFYVIVVLEGVLHFTDTSGTARIEPGRMAVLRPGSHFELHTEEGGYSGIAVERTDPGISDLAGESFVTDPSTRILLLGEWIAEELVLPGDHSEEIIQNLAHLVVQIALRRSGERPAGEPQLARSAYWAQRARRAIENSIYVVQGVREALAGFPVSYRQLSRFVDEQFGVSPKELQLQARLQEARRLLLETDWSVITIALELGFSSPQHFSTLFKKREQLPPVEWLRAERTHRLGSGRECNSMQSRA